MRLPAQTLPPRGNFVFHVYVDPIFGDDALAFQHNPGPAPAPMPPLGFHPTAALNGVGGLLQQAPYAFRTLTGPQGVGAYLDQLSAAYGIGSLPWVIHLPQGDVLVSWVIVHCLPGLYAPALATDTPPFIDSRSGLRFNGEVWPFVLKDRVSLQGTSALDTVFDARGQTTAILLVPGIPTPTLQTHVHSFVDGLTIRGARTNGLPMDPTNHSGAGILITRPGAVGVTISNCFIVDNTVGLAVDSDPPNPQQPHRLIVVNNTFARNRIGVWNGDRLNTNIGWGEISLLNCVFDSWIPGVPAASTCPFAGVNGDDLVVNQVLTNFTFWTPNPPFGQSYCAWEAGKAAIAAPNWQVPTPRVGNGTPMPAPRVDLTPFTGAAGPRGTLFINDLLRNNPTVGAGSEYSPHDFRLSPMVNTNAGPPPAGSFNPLVNQGITADTNPLLAHHIQALSMGNNLAIGWLLIGGRPPGLRLPQATVPFGPEDFATLHAWDWDAEGFGNPRLTPRGFPTPDVPNNTSGVPIFQSIDLGADEMGELIIAGFIDSTRVLSRFVPQAPGITDHTRMFFVHNANLTAPRPKANEIVGRDVTWWAHVQQSPSPANYTSGVVPSLRNFLITAPPPPHQPKPPFMRNLECDFSPHLWPDPHPAWGVAYEVQYGFTDIYGAMPWYWSPNPDPVAAFPFDNAYVFYNPAPGYPQHQTNFTSASFGVQHTQVIVGLVNSPGSALDPTGAFLSAMYPVGQLGPWSPCSTGPNYATNAWGLGDSGFGCPDIAPIAGFGQPQWLGHRYNAQLITGLESPPESNLQTFLTVNGVPPLLEPEEPSPENLSTPRLHEPQVERMRRHLSGR